MSYKNRSADKFNGVGTPEENNGELLTIPGMAVDLKTQIARMQAGMEVQRYTPYFQSDHDPNFEQELPPFEKMTTLERLQWAAEKREALAGNLEEYRARIKGEIKANAEKKRNEEIEKEVSKRMKTNQVSNPKGEHASGE